MHYMALAVGVEYFKPAAMRLAMPSDLGKGSGASSRSRSSKLRSQSSMIRLPISRRPPLSGAFSISTP